MTVTLAAPPGEAPRPAPAVDPDEHDRALREGVQGLQSRAERLVRERALALLLAASLARLARSYRRDRDRLLRANLGLQRALDGAAVRQRHADARTEALVREVAELQATRRDLTAVNALLAADNQKLRPLAAADPRPPGRSRRRRR